MICTFEMVANETGHQRKAQRPFSFSSLVDSLLIYILGKPVPVLKPT
jgi:hypothetical protein